MAIVAAPCAAWLTEPDTLTGPVLVDELDCPAIVLTPWYPAACDRQPLARRRGAASLAALER